ncbi:MAG: hypothetical protein AAFW84_21370 [Cyanobacteria bacterium J06635_15]
MTEFNSLPILDGLEPDDRIACTDASDQRNLKQLPVSTLMQALQLGGGSGGSAVPPDPAKANSWTQVNGEGLILSHWIPSPDRTRWLSAQTWTVGYSETGGFKSWFQAGNPIPGDVWIEALYISGLSDGDFSSGDRRDVQVSLFDETGTARAFVTYEVQGLTDGQRLVAQEPIRTVKPLSECLYFQIRGLKRGSAPKVKYVTVSLTLRWAYGA